MEAYTRQHDVGAAQATRAALLQDLPKEKEVQSRILLHDVLAHRGQWPAAGQRLPKADSLALGSVYEANTSVSEQAATWLRYYYPHVAPYRGQSVLSTTPAIHARPQAVRVALEAAAYPNPAASSFTVRYRVAQPSTRSELQVTNLLTGARVLQIPLSVAKPGLHEQSVDVSALPDGQYAYWLLADGQATPTQHLIIRK